MAAPYHIKLKRTTKNLSQIQDYGNTAGDLRWGEPVVTKDGYMVVGDKKNNTPNPDGSYNSNKVSLLKVFKAVAQSLVETISSTNYYLADRFTFWKTTEKPPAYSTSSTYAVGDRVTYNNQIYQCKTAINTGESWNASHWDLLNPQTLPYYQGTHVTLLKESGTSRILLPDTRSTYVAYSHTDNSDFSNPANVTTIQSVVRTNENAITTLQNDIVDLTTSTYDPTSTYAVGDYVIYNGGLYSCKTAISTPEAWNASHWNFIRNTEVTPITPGITQPYHVGATAPSDTKLLWIDTAATTGGLKYYNGSAWVAVPVKFS